MARRAQQGSVARCPYCEAYLPQVAVECPSCRFPLTMDAADGGFLAPEHSGTTSTATPGGRSVSPLVAGHPGAGRARAHGGRAHRMRMTAWLLAVTTVLLLLAAVATLITATSPEAVSDREAKSNLVAALAQARSRPDRSQLAAVQTVAADVASDGPPRVSTDVADGIWFGAAKSNSGTCFFLAGRLADGVLVGRGPLPGSGPCRAAQVHRNFDEINAKANGKS